jgi:hypothetical protein
LLQLCDRKAVLSNANVEFQQPVRACSKSLEQQSEERQVNELQAGIQILLYTRNVIGQIECVEELRSNSAIHGKKPP